MDEIEQATAAPGEKRDVSRKVRTVTCPHCGMPFEVDE